jgi:predicted dithiol-disulfide oxidoreductase (DUF899 family)
MSLPPVVSREEWLAARLALLDEEKALTQARDAVSTRRRLLPMVELDKQYVFDRIDGPGGEIGLGDVFDGRRQLIVYHAMWLDDRGLACPSCSAFLDQIGHLAHLRVRDTVFAAVSRGPVDQMRAFKARMGWTFPWYSSRRSDFNYDFHVSFDETRAPIEYNFLGKAELEAAGAPVGEWEQPFDLHGLSVFLRDRDRVFHTYSTYARGTDSLGFISNFLDLTPLGRQEPWEEPKGRSDGLGTGARDTRRYHDEYED